MIQNEHPQAASEQDTFTVKVGLAEMLKGGAIMDVTNVEQAKIAEDAGAIAVMALERIPSDIRRDGGVARMSDPDMIRQIQAAVDKHLEMLRAMDVDCRRIRFAHELVDCVALIIPGGESTTMSLLIQKFDLYDKLREFADDELAGIDLQVNISRFSPVRAKGGVIAEGAAADTKAAITVRAGEAVIN